MTGASGGAGPDSPPKWLWDVALSFAGAQRNYVGQVAEALKAYGVRCFYDANEQIPLWGKPLAEVLPAIYGEQAAAVVVFVSAEYAAREWTRLERRAALNRAVRERREYLLPARFDDTPLPGLLPDVSYVDLRSQSPQQFADLLARKLADLGICQATDMKREPSKQQEEGPREEPRPQSAKAAGGKRTASEIAEQLDAALDRLGAGPQARQAKEQEEGHPE